MSECFMMTTKLLPWCGLCGEWRWVALGGFGRCWVVLGGAGWFWVALGGFGWRWVAWAVASGGGVAWWFWPRCIFSEQLLDVRALHDDIGWRWGDLSGGWRCWVEVLGRGVW